MRRTLAMLIAVGVTTTSLIGATTLPASALTASIVIVRKQAGTATFFYTPGCILTEIVVNVVKGNTQHIPGTTIPGDQMSVSVTQFDQCANNLLVDAAGVVPTNFRYDLQPDLKKAELHVTGVPMIDTVQAVGFDVNVDLSWAGAGTLQHTHTATTTHPTPNSTVVTVSDYYARDVAPATGTITAVPPFPPGVNLNGNLIAAGPSVSAALDRLMSAEVTVQK